MHHLYTTKAFVIDSYPFREADMKVVLLTKDLGVIQATVTSGRKNESKHKQSIQEFSLIDVALIYGKGGWRLTNVVIDHNLYHSLSREEIGVVAKIFSLIKRMIPEEENNEEIYNIVEKGIELIKEDIEVSEIVTVYMILDELGYVDNKSTFEELIPLVKKAPKKYIAEVNNGIKESQL